MYGSSLPVALHAINIGRHVHHRFTGPHAGYVAVWLAAAVSGAGFPDRGRAR
jgi:hypothetical protein